MESVRKPPLVVNSNGHVTVFTTTAASSNGNLDSECGGQHHHHEPYGHLSPPTRRTSDDLMAEDDHNGSTTIGLAAATTNGVQYEQRISLSPVLHGAPGLEDTNTTQHYYASTIPATPQQQQLTTKQKPIDQHHQHEKSTKYVAGDGEQFDVPSSVILTEFSGSSVDDELLETESEESSTSRKHRLKQHSAQVSKRNREKMQCVVEVCRKLKNKNRNLRGSVKKQHRELTSYRSMHSSLASMPADYTIPPLSARGERNGVATAQGHSRTPSNIIEQMYPHSTPPICRRQEEYCGASITLESYKAGAPAHKKCLASIANSSFAINNNDPANNNSTTPAINATPEERLMEQINSIGVPNSSTSSPDQCIELLRHLLLRAMLQCRAGEEVIQELERERRGTAITFMRIKKENADLVAARDEADGKLRALEAAHIKEDPGNDDRDQLEESGSIAAEVGNNERILNNEEAPNGHHPEAQRQTSTIRRKASSFHLSQRHVAGGHFSTDSSAPVSPAHHAHSNASGGYGLSSNGGAVGSGGRRTSSSALTGAGGAGGGAASFVRSLSADRSVASSTKYGGGTDRPGTPASTSVGFRRSRPVPQHPPRGGVGSAAQLESSIQDDANTSGDINTSDNHPNLSASGKLNPTSTTATPIVPALRRIATSPTIQANRSPRGAPTSGVKGGGVPDTVRTGVRTPISSRPLSQKVGSGSGSMFPIVSTGRTTSPTTRTPLMGSSTLRSTSATKRTPITTNISTPSQSLRPSSTHVNGTSNTNKPAMNGSRTTSPATAHVVASRNTITASGGIKSAGTPKAAAAGGTSSSKVVPAGISRDKQRAMLNHSPISKPRGVTPTTPSGRRLLQSGGGDAVASKVSSHRNNVGATKANPTTSRTTVTDSSARKALTSSPLR